MPFTISHIAAVLPFRRYTPIPLSFTAMAIGSMVPDFEYFVRMTLYGHYGHTLPGIFIFDIPMGVVLFLLYLGIIQEPLINHLPPFFYARLRCTLIPDWRNYTVTRAGFILLSLIIGILTHFIWDGFTHDEEYQVARYVPILLHTFSVHGYMVSLHFILQILSSLLGLVILVIWLIRLTPQAAPPLSFSKRSRFWTSISAGTLVIMLLRYLAGIPAEKLFFQFIVISISAFLLSLLLVCIFCKVVYK
jgi:hypothetical protein